MSCAAVWPAWLLSCHGGGPRFTLEGFVAAPFAAPAAPPIRPPATTPTGPPTTPTAAPEAAPVAAPPSARSGSRGPQETHSVSDARASRAGSLRMVDPFNARRPEPSLREPKSNAEQPAWSHHGCHRQQDRDIDATRASAQTATR